MNFKRPVLLSVFWLPGLLLAGWLLFAVISGWQHPREAPRTAAQTQADAPPAAANPLPALLFPETELFGKYYMGNYLSRNCALTLTANHRFTFEWTGSLSICDGKGNCEPYVNDSNTGTWEMQGDVLVMRPEKPNIRDGLRGMATRLIPVIWSKRCHLIDENQMPAFCVAARDATPGKPGDGYDELRTIYYIQVKDWKPVPVSGKSLLPERYREFYEQGPVTGQIVRIDAQGQALLDAGRANRVRAGMLLTVISPYGVDLKVLSVREHSAVCKIMYRWYGGERVKAGAACTTGTEEYRPEGIGSWAYDAPPEAEKPAANQGRAAAALKPL